MYVGMDEKLRSLHRNVKTVGSEKLTSEEFDNLRKAVQTASEDDLKPTKKIGGFVIVAITNHIKVGSITSNITVKI